MKLIIVKDVVFIVTEKLKILITQLIFYNMTAIIYAIYIKRIMTQKLVFNQLKNYIED